MKSHSLGHANLFPNYPARIYFTGKESHEEFATCSLTCSLSRPA